MGVKVLGGYIEAKGKKRLASAALYDSVTMTAFGPVITVDGAATVEEAAELAEGFAEYVEDKKGVDPRQATDEDLHNLLVLFLKEQAEGAETEDEQETQGGAA